MTRWRNASALSCGVLFALGLGLSGMTDARKVIGFLRVFGAWDPSLIFVMISAIAVHLGFAQYARRGGKPLLAPRFVLPEATALDPRLLAGATLFGVGWGLSGLCPGPALVSLVTGSREVLLFCMALALGMVLVEAVDRARKALTTIEP